MIDQEPPDRRPPQPMPRAQQCSPRAGRADEPELPLAAPSSSPLPRGAPARAGTAPQPLKLLVVDPTRRYSISSTRAESRWARFRYEPAKAPVAANRIAEAPTRQSALRPSSRFMLRPPAGNGSSAQREEGCPCRRLLRGPFGAPAAPRPSPPCCPTTRTRNHAVRGSARLHDLVSRRRLTEGLQALLKLALRVAPAHVL